MPSKFFKTDGDRIKFTGTYMEAYVPIAYFDMNIAAEYGGEYTEVLGLFNARFFSDAEGKKPIGSLETVNIPTNIKIYPTSYYEKEMSLISGQQPERYRIYRFYNGDDFTDSNIIKSSKNAEAFLKVLESGKIPRTIPYNKIFDIWTKNMVMNGVKMPDVPAANREMIVAEIYRYKKSPADRFALHIGKNPKMSQFDYIPANARTLTKYSSTFAGLAFEDIDTMITNGININRSGRKQSESPIEEIIKY